MHNEQSLLIQSIAVGGLFGIGGIIIGLLSGSQMLIFDGVYSFLGVLLSGISLLALRFMDVDEKSFPFGKSAIEPLITTVNYFVLLVIVMYSMISAGLSLLSGGREITVSLALIYTLIGGGACFYMHHHLKKQAGSQYKGIVEAESKQWLLDGVVSSGVAFAFVVMLIFEMVGVFTWALPYLDPVMVIIVSLYFIKTPIHEMLGSLKSLLLVAPDDAFQAPISDVIKSIEKAQGFKSSTIRIAKDTRVLWVEVDYVVGDDHATLDVKHQDALRQQIYDVLKTYPYEIWMSVAFTNNQTWTL